jgi:hypothetical protein
VKWRVAALAVLSVGVLAVIIHEATKSTAPPTGSSHSSAAATLGPPQHDPYSRNGSLTPKQVAAARTVIDSDSRLRRLVRNRPFTIPQVASWTSVEGRTLIGASALVRLRKPISIPPSNWPIAVVAPAPGIKPLMVRRAYRISAKNVSEINAEVDLRRGRVLTLRPFNGPDMVLHSIRDLGPPLPRPYVRYLRRHPET